MRRGICTDTHTNALSAIRKCSAALSSPQIATNSLVSVAPRWLEANQIYADDLSLSFFLLAIHGTHLYSAPECFFFFLPAQQRLALRLTLTTLTLCANWECAGVSALPVESRFGGKLRVQQMEICDAFLNSCVLPVTSLKRCQLFT